MPVTVNLISKHQGVLKNFLDNYYEKDTKTDCDVVEWINIYNNPLEAIELMTTVTDNSDNFDINLFISMDFGIIVEVNQDNINDIVKFMLFRYYKNDHS